MSGRKYSFEENLEYGNFAQNIVVDYLKNVLGYSFIGGDIDGKTINIDEIERIANCKYIPIKNGDHGAQLMFVDSNENVYIFTMPDELMLRNSNNSYRWVEVKSQRNNIYSYGIRKSRVYEYLQIEKYSKIPVFIIFVVKTVGMGCYDLYWSTPKEILENKNEERDGYLYFEIKMLSKLNKKPIEIEEDW